MNTHRQRRSFTLVEMMAVVALIGLLVTVSIPAMNGLMNSSNLTSAGQTVADQIGLARQTASARNRAVEIRFIRLSADARGYDAMQLWMTSANGEAKPLNRLTSFPTGIVVSDDTTNLSKALEFADSGVLGSNLYPNAEYVALQIRPSGLVTPTLPMSDLYLTVLRARDAEDGNLPSNYLTVQLNPNTGVPLIFRP
ncbi:MAG: Verru_Chthon cassette protein D [Verrucomicrobiales bacterium]|nr:Verru_Chthon cassette protein D [Verrucomicrobiales bacterium]